MSAIAFNWAPFEIEAEVEPPTERLVNIRKGCSREEEFRSALDGYIADYRKNRRIMDAKKLL